MNTDTPRTDALEFNYATSGGGWGKPFDFARKLERELNEQCRLNGKGSEREAALLGKVERLERELKVADYWSNHHAAHADELIKENARLREALALTPR